MVVLIFRRKTDDKCNICFLGKKIKEIICHLAKINLFFNRAQWGQDRTCCWLRKREKHDARHTNGEIEVIPWWVDAGFKCTGPLSVRWQIAKCVRSGGGVAVYVGTPVTTPALTHSHRLASEPFCFAPFFDWIVENTEACRVCCSMKFDSMSSGCLLLLRAFGWCSLLLQFIFLYDLLVVMKGLFYC